MATIKISKKDITQMIQEEYSKKLTEISLKNRLHQINEEMANIIAEDDMEEQALVGVEAGKEEPTVGPGGEKNGGKKYSANFIIKEDEDELGGEEIGGEEIGGEEIESDDDNTDIKDILSQLADALINKIEDTAGKKETGEEDSFEINVDDENANEEVPSEEEMPSEEENADEVKADEEEITETKQLVSEATKKRMQILSGVRRNDFND